MMANTTAPLTEARSRGYAKIAERMSSQPGLTIVRRFNALNTLLLLYRQAELVKLESRLREQAAADAGAQGLSQYFDRNWEILAEADANNQPSEQWRIITDEIEPKLESYSESTKHHIRVTC